MIHFHHHPTCMLLVKLCIFFVQNKFVAVFVKLMSLLQTSEGALDPSYFLKCLKQIISKAGNPAFDLFAQQDGAKMLSYIL